MEICIYPLPCCAEFHIYLFLSLVVVTIGKIILDKIKNSLYMKIKEREESSMASKLLACQTIQVVQSFIHIDLQEEE